MSRQYNRTNVHQVKLVIWDLDDTIWSGTLAEGDVELAESTVQLIQSLAERGIVSSICSKNDADAARRVLEAHGAWHLFAFPQIAFAPKGLAVAAQIRRARLRPENVLFVDDNLLNLAEAARQAPGLLARQPQEAMPELQAFVQNRPPADPTLSRLRQYRQIAKRDADFDTGGQEWAGFLRQCKLRVAMSPVTPQILPRVVELANRANQLNFTKTRLNTPVLHAALLRDLQDDDHPAWSVSAEDRYGSYGLIGFAMLARSSASLKHFVFSCRVMHLGIEQFVWDYLGRPRLVPIPPLAIAVPSYGNIDWIALTADVVCDIAHPAELVCDEDEVVRSIGF